MSNNVDFLQKIYDVVSKDEIITNIVENRITFYTYKDYDIEKKAFLVLRPMNAKEPLVYGNDIPMNYQQDIQIDVQSTNRKDCMTVMNRIEDILVDINCRQLGYNALDEWIEPVGRFVLAKRFRIKTNYEGE